ncbi:MAG: protein kinase [Pirellulaceae bacterium]|nr:protein kinase [Pirellulaceae bacterium]
MSEVPGKAASPARRIYQIAKGLAADRREEYLLNACHNDERLRNDVRRLLDADSARANNVLQRAIDKLAPLVEEQWSEKDIPTAWQSIEGDAPNEHHDAPELPPHCRYTLAEKVGEGGMGVVYRARQTAPLDREVAIKVIKPGMDSHAVLRRFRTEQQALARMTHPHIASVYDSGETTRGHPYFVMEFVDGAPLDKYCHAHELSLTDRLSLMIEVCSAIDHAHQQSIVHRDLKPSNLLVSHLGDRPQVKVIDFGVAKALDQDAGERTQFTNFAHCIGTPLYMSPEQVAFDNAPIDARSDVYALGAILYLLITGQPPFTAETLYAAGFDGLRKLIRDVDPPPPSVRLRGLGGPTAKCNFVPTDPSQWAAPDNTRIREELDWIVMRALAKEPERRYASAQELGDDLGRFLRQETVLAARPSTVYRISKFAQRQRGPIIFASLLCTTLAAIGLAAWALNRDSQNSNAIVQSTTAPTVDNLVRKDGPLPTAERLPSSLDVLESANLQRLLLEMAAGDLASMSDIDLPHTGDGLFLGSPKEGDSHGNSPSLRSLLSTVSHPTPERVFQHPQRVTDAALSPDGSQVATTCGDGMLRIWQVDTGRLLHQLGPHINAAESVAYSPVENLLASGDKEGVVYLWDAETGDQIYATEEHQGGAQSIAWSPDGRLLAVGIRYEGVDILNAHDGSRYLWVDGGDDGPRYEQVQFSPTGDKLYVPAKVGRIGLQGWEVTTKELSSAIELVDIEYPPRTLSFVGRERGWLVVGDRYRFSIANRHGGHQHGTFAPGPSFARRLSVSQDGLTMAGAFAGGQVVVWQVNESAPDQPPQLDIQVVFKAHAPSEGCVTSVQLAHNDTLLTAGEDGRACLWDLNQVLPIRTRIAAHSVAMVPLANEQLLALSSKPSSEKGSSVIAGVVHTVEGSSREVFHSEIAGFTQSIPQHTAYSADALALAGSAFVELRRLGGKWQQLQRIAVTESMPSVSFGSSGKRLYVVGKRSVSIHESMDDWQTAQVIAIWDTTSNSGLHMEADQGDTLIVQHNKNGREDTTRLEEFRVSDGSRLRSWGSGHAAFAISGDNSLLALGTSDSLEIYDRGSGKLLWSQVIAKATRQLAFTDHDRILLVLQIDDQLRAWHLPTQQHIGSILSKPMVGRHSAFLFPTDSLNRLYLWCRHDDLRDRIIVVGH